MRRHPTRRAAFFRQQGAAGHGIPGPDPGTGVPTRRHRALPASGQGRQEPATRPDALAGPAGAHGLAAARLPGWARPLALGCGCAALLALPARAQLSSFSHVAVGGSSGPRDAPVTFNADTVSYDSHNGIVTLEGHVEAWQNDRVVRADRVTYDRNTNVLAATGHVVMAEPDGQVLFADYAELTQGMRDGVLSGMRALLAQNGRLAANGAKRTEGKVNELSRAVYTTCNPCALDPSRPPLWQIRAFQATQDLEHKRIEYRDAYLDIFGVPVAYLPYFANASPDAKRQSGLLTPGVGLTDKHLGTFVSIPYYFVLDDQSDATVTTTLATQNGPQVAANYRRRFNDGFVNLSGAIAYEHGAQQDTSTIGSTSTVNQGAVSDKAGPAAYFLGRGQFSLNDTWRYGFNINVASSSLYTRDFRLPGYGADVYASSVYAEGFGVGSYARVDALAFQALNTTVTQDRLPYVLPRYSYSYFGQPDALGGRLSLDTTEYNVLRETGTSDQRTSLAADWQRPFAGPLGQRYLLTLRAEGAAYHYTALDQQPNYSNVNAGESAHALPTAALVANWPFARNGGGGSSQLIEPIVQLITAPQSGNSRLDHIANEDALDYEFTDSTLFSLNRYSGQGVDRMDGGTRVNAGIHANWTFAGSQQVDALVGQSYRQHVDHNELPLTGLENHVSDVVARATYIPAGWLDFTGRTRVNKNNGDITFADGLASAGTKLLRFNAGYIYDQRDPYYRFDGTSFSSTLPATYFTPRNEVEVGATSQYGPWKFTGFARRDLQLGRMVAVGARGTYENECFIFDANFYRRYTSILNDNGDTTLLFTLTFKTIGQFGFNG